MLVFQVKNQTISRLDNMAVIADSRGYLGACFRFTPDWDGKMKTAIFKRGSTVLEAALTGDEVPPDRFPAQMLEGGGEFSVSVYAGDLITTNAAAVRVVESGYIEDAPPALPVQPAQAYVKTFDSQIPYIRHRGGVFEFTLDGSTWTQVKNGEGIASAVLGSDGHLKLTRTDGQVLDAGYARGETGDSGVHIGADAPSDGRVRIWIDPAG